MKETLLNLKGFLTEELIKQKSLKEKLYNFKDTKKICLSIKQGIKLCVSTYHFNIELIYTCGGIYDLKTYSKENKFLYKIPFTSLDYDRMALYFMSISHLVEDICIVEIGYQ